MAVDNHAMGFNDNFILPSATISSAMRGSTASNALAFVRSSASLSKQLPQPSQNFSSLLNGRTGSLTRRTRDSQDSTFLGSKGLLLPDPDTEAVEKERIVARATSSNHSGGGSSVVKGSTAFVPHLHQSRPQSITQSHAKQSKKEQVSISLSSSSATNSTDSATDSAEDDDGAGKVDDDDEDDTDDDGLDESRIKEQGDPDEAQVIGADQNVHDETENEQVGEQELRVELNFPRRLSSGSRFRSTTISGGAGSKRRSSFGHHMISLASAISMPDSPCTSDRIDRVGHHLKARGGSLGNERDAISNGLGIEVSSPSRPFTHNASRSKSRAISQSNRLAEELKQRLRLEEQEKSDGDRSRKDDVRQKELVSIEERKRVDDLREGVKRSIKATLESYAEQGDTQLCAIVCCVLQSQRIDLHLAPLFVARLSKAYLDLLRRSKLFTASAALIKYCDVELLQSQAQVGLQFSRSAPVIYADRK